METQGHTPPIQPLYREHAQFGKNSKEEGIHKRKVYKRVILIVILFALAFVVVTGITYSVYGFSAYRSLMAAKKNIESAEAMIKTKDLNKATTYLAASHTEIGEAKKSLAKLSFLSYLPVVGAQYDAALHLVNATFVVGGTLSQVVDAGSQVISAVQGTPDSEISLATLTAEQKSQFLQKLHEVSPVFEGASQDLALAEIELSKISDSGILRQIVSYSNELKRLVPTLHEGMDLASSLSKVGPDLAGYKQEKRYLVLFLNNSELRPGGGFIGSYGLMKVKNGEIIDFPTRDSWLLDQTYKGDEPPEPIKKYMNPKLWMRDANWSPDFPESSEVVLGFYRRESHDEGNIDGVIGLTPNVIEHLMQLIGPIQVPGYPYTFTPENFDAELDYAVEYDYARAGLSYENRKQILGDLNKTLLNKILALPQDHWKDMLRILSESFTSKQVMFYPTKTLFERDTINQIVQKENWDGHIIQTDSDYLMVVDANLLALKTDPVVDRTIDYRVHMTPDNKLMARVVLTYKNTGFHGPLTGAYTTYTRILAPKGSVFINAENVDTKTDVLVENEKASFGFYKRINPQDTQIMTIDYQLPESLLNQVKAGAYKLLVQKQLGSFNHKLNVTFQSEKRIMDSEPIAIPFVLNSFNEGTFSADLSQDHNFEVHIK